MKNLFLIIALCLSSTTIGQNLSPGFKYLESGNFTEAESFFKEVLKTYPTNKTALLCFGRATGLAGDTTLAIETFKSLQEEYPSDFEIALNYAEALLWDGQFETARNNYTELLQLQPQNFSALLGMGNTLSNLKNYIEAILFIEKALQVSPGNDNALISLKYARLGKAELNRQKREYPKALQTLQLNLKNHTNDTQTLSAMASIMIEQKNYQLADSIYQQITNPVISAIGRSLIAHKQDKTKIALSKAKFAMQSALELGDSTLIANSEERYIQALLWNKKFGEATKRINLLLSQNANSKMGLGLQAALTMYKGNSKNGIAIYKRILKLDSASFNGNLGIANAYFANRNLDQARRYAQRTLEFYENQQDALNLLTKIEKQQRATFRSNYSISSDNGGNEAQNISLGITLPMSDKFEATIDFSNRNTNNTISSEEATQTSAQLGLKYHLKGQTSLQGNVGLLKADAINQQYSGVNGSLFLEMHPLPLQFLKIGYSRELQNFNAALLDEKIYMNSLVLNHNISTAFGLGWYTGYDYTMQSDDNKRHNLFTSLYYNFSSKPFIKAGLNYQFLSFDKQVPKLYFSPEKYQSVEIFSELSHNWSRWNINAIAAYGQQWVESNDPMKVFRIEGKISRTLSDRLNLAIYGKYSNSASESVSGFEINEFGIQLNWALFKKPIYSLK